MRGADKSVAVSGHGLNKPRRLSWISQCETNVTDTTLERVARTGSSSPTRGEEFLAGDESPGPFSEVANHRKILRTEGDLLSAFPLLFFRQIKAEWRNF